MQIFQSKFESVSCGDYRNNEQGRVIMIDSDAAPYYSSIVR